jgi:hypothetical protein
MIPAYVIWLFLGITGAGLLCFFIWQYRSLKTDRLWWLPILFAVMLPFFGMLLTEVCDWFSPHLPPLDSGEIRQPFCYWVLFLNSIPGLLAAACILTTPAIMMLLKRNGLKKNRMSILLAFYVCAAAIGLIGTISFVGYTRYPITNAAGSHIIGEMGTPHLEAVSPGAPMASMLLALDALTICLALIALILGWREKRILLRTAVTPILCLLFTAGAMHIILSLGGTGSTCGPGNIITVS